MKTVRWGMIGAGDVAQVKSGPAFQKAEHSQLIAVMRRTPGLASDYARRHNVPHAYERAQDLIEDPQVDAVYIASPPGSHAELALLVCHAGKPAYIEKPMARNDAECHLINEAFAARKLPLFVAYYRRSLPRFLVVRDLLNTGQLGQIQEIRYRYSTQLWRGDRAALPWRLQAEHSAGGLLLDVGCHTLDLLDFLFGALIDVEGTASNRSRAYDVEDQVSMTFRTAGGYAGSATWDFAASGPEDLLEIVGAHGRVLLTVFGNEPIVWERTGLATESIARPNPEHIQQPLIQSIVDELRGEGCCPSTGESAARTSRVMDVVLNGYYGGRSDRFWERPQSWPGRPLAR